MLKKSFKKIASFILIFAITVTHLVPIPVSANEIVTRIYYLDNLEIEYNIIASWDNNQNVSITLTNLLLTIILLTIGLIHKI